jgi:hypothetical protein
MIVADSWSDFFHPKGCIGKMSNSKQIVADRHLAEETENGKFDMEQYRLLRHCSRMRDMTRWNIWRNQHRDVPVLLEGVDLKRTHLVGADLRWANLAGANFLEAHIEGANFFGARLEGAHLTMAFLEGAIFRFARIDAETVIAECNIDRNTDFTGVGLDAARIGPNLKEAMKDNIRRKQWQRWFKSGAWWLKVMKNITVRPFWWLTDYGSSTPRIIYSFLFLAICFGLIYYGFETHPKLDGIIHNLRIGKMDDWHVLARSMYFSIVTMTTLGFGDMHAVKSNETWALYGYLFLSIQVIIGYVLLGALVTRLGVLFSGSGLAQKPNKTKRIRRGLQLPY